MPAEKAFISCSHRAEKTGPSPGLNSLKLQRHCQSRSRHCLGKPGILTGEMETSEWMLLNALTAQTAELAEPAATDSLPPLLRTSIPLPTPSWMTMQRCLSPGNTCPPQDLLSIQDTRCRIAVKENSTRDVLSLKTGETDQITEPQRSCQN